MFKNWLTPSFMREREVAVKENPAQRIIRDEYSTDVSTNSKYIYLAAFKKLESVNRGTNMIVSACTSLNFDVKESLPASVVPGVRKKSLEILLNYRPNPYQNIAEFRDNIFTDLILEGNAFIYWDGSAMYHLPASKVIVHPDPVTFVNRYTYDNREQFDPSTIIHIKDLSSDSIYRGSSRLESAERSIRILYKMQEFQEGFFDNGAISGVIITTDNTLSTQAKERTVAYWQQKYSTKNGAKKPLILDSGMKPVPLNTSTFKDMDFDVSIKTHDTKILKALGVPPILLDGGNNANISPNLRLFYLETVLPLVNKLSVALERFFGYDISPVTANVSALQPELKDVAAYHTTLVNGGVVTPNEARVELRYAKVIDAEADKLRVPANIAGSAADPSQGGKPKAPASNKE